jgi:hypothetical protein
MFGMAPAGVLALVDRPATSWLVIAVAVAAAGWAHHLWSQRALLPDDPPLGEPSIDTRPAALDGHPLEPPAVVALLTNRFHVPLSAITATALDLAARGWVRLTVVDDELAVVTRSAPAAGDALRPYEQQVLNHLASRAFHDVSSAGTLALSQHRLDRRWRQRFRQAVSAEAQQLGLSRRRYSAASVAPGLLCAGFGLVAVIAALAGGEQADFAATWKPAAVALATLLALAVLAQASWQRVISADQAPTERGIRRAAEWMQYRRRLQARIPGAATVLAPPAQQAALAVAAVMGVSEQVLTQLPIAPEEPRWAWSEAGDRPHLVEVRYPVRPGYGQHPLRVAGSGATVLVLAWLLQRFLNGIADGTRLESLLERVPGQVDLITTLAEVLAVLCWIPILWAAWSLAAGLVDLVATRERIGLVVRTRRPSDVVPLAQALNPLADRSRFASFLAVDDGRRGAVTAWLATERSSAPQGAQARVRATPLLGYVRSSEPVGTGTRT